MTEFDNGEVMITDNDLYEDKMFSNNEAPPELGREPAEKRKYRKEYVPRKITSSDLFKPEFEQYYSSHCNIAIIDMQLMGNEPVEYAIAILSIDKAPEYITRNYRSQNPPLASQKQLRHNSNYIGRSEFKACSRSIVNKYISLEQDLERIPNECIIVLRGFQKAVKIEEFLLQSKVKRNWNLFRFPFAFEDGPNCGAHINHYCRCAQVNMFNMISYYFKY